MFHAYGADANDRSADTYSRPQITFYRGEDNERKLADEHWLEVARRRKRLIRAQIPSQFVSYISTTTLPSLLVLAVCAHMDWSINSDDHPKGEFEFDEAFRLLRYGIGMATAILATPKVVALTAPLVGLVRRVHDMCTVSDDVARLFAEYEAKAILVDGSALVVQDLVCVPIDLARISEPALRTASR